MNRLPRWQVLPMAFVLVSCTETRRTSTPEAAKVPEPTQSPEPAQVPEPAKAPEPPQAAEPGSESEASSTPEKTASMVPADHPLYPRVEGKGFKNQCQRDGDCHVGGCSKEVCSAEKGIQSTCEARSWPTEGLACRCVASECVWHQGQKPKKPKKPKTSKTSKTPKDKKPSSTTDGANKSDLPRQGKPCAQGRCAPGLTCVEYYGIAGPRGPKFSSCEIRCADDSACPKGQSCVTIADGPGRVCRKRG